MERVPSEPPLIAALPPDSNRPLWSIMIPAYNCSAFLAEAIESVLLQDIGVNNMQIEVVDDCSTDADIEQLVKDISGGRVSYYRQDKNVGSLRNFETCINRSTGQYIHLLHGDDRVKPGFYTNLSVLFEQYPTAGAAFCAWDYIDSSGDFIVSSQNIAFDIGVIDDCLNRLSVVQLLQVVTIVVKREVYEKLGSFYSVTYGEDWEMWARIAKNYPIVHIPKVLAEYREHSDSISSNSFVSGQNIRDILKVSLIINSYLPVSDQKRALKQIRQNYAYYACNISYHLWLNSKKKGIISEHIFEILKLSRNYNILKLIAKLLILVYTRPLRKFYRKLFSIATYRVKKVLPIKIIHINLKDISLPLHLENDIYYVFWWKEIPLGHSFFKVQDLKMDEIAKNRKIIDALIPAIDSYTNNFRLQMAYKRAFRMQNASLFCETLTTIFESDLPASLPEKVNISVVICTSNRAENLNLCLQSLLKQKCVPAEIIVIDNAPDNDSTKIVVEQYNTVSYYIEMRPGLDIARNTGARLARFSIIAYTNDDVIVHPLWTYRVWEMFSYPNIDAITGLVIASELDTESQQIFEEHWGFNKGYKEKFYNKEFINPNNNSIGRVWDIGAGANMAFRKSTLEKVNFFDERLDVGAAGCNGDSEIWYRILRKGMIIQYSPRAVVFHTHRKEIAHLKKQVFNFMRGFVTSLLIQNEQNKQNGYKREVYLGLPKYYGFLLLTGLPTYSFRYKTLISEIRGIISGVIYFHKNKNKPSITKYN